MTEGSRVSKQESMATTATSTAATTTTATSVTKQRKKRKWDQPAESLISAGLAIPGVLPLGNMGNLVGISLSAVAPLSGALTNSVPVTGVSVPQMFQAPIIQQNAAAIVQKLNQPKIQDELIAREIVINDAEPTIRYKLTKRQTQEEIQKCSGAVVITRGKYRPPNGIPDSEKPLYLHISAGAHLKETAERIKAVDRAAAMVEEILRQGQNSKPTSTPIIMNTGGQANQLLSTSLYLGFDPDPSLNIAARIRGPNDQYINHIMNETGATVILRGRGSGNLETSNGEEMQQPLHLYLSSNNAKSLEDAKLLAEHLLDTISVECGASRISSCKVYSAVPPPQQLLAGVSNSAMEPKVNVNAVAGSTCSTIGTTSGAPSLTVTQAPISSVVPPQGPISQPGAMFHYGQSQSNMVCYPQPSLTGGTSYSGYGGIYPQATPLQQVALALRQAPAQASSVLAPTAPMVGTSPKMMHSSPSETEKRPPQKRKFQELPASSKGSVTTHQVFSLTFSEADRPWSGPVHRTLGLHVSQNLRQGSEFLKPGVPTEDVGPEFLNQRVPTEDAGPKNVSTIPPPKKLDRSTSNGMRPPPSMMPPPAPKFPNPPPSQKADSKNSIANKPIADPVPDPLMKLVEYGEEDDDIEGTGEESPKTKSGLTTGKPFWAL